MAPFSPSLIGGPWGRRIARRRAWIDDLPWDQVGQGTDYLRWAWTQTTFSEYASAAAFAEIAAALAAAAAPIDLTAAAGDFVVDEMIHVEVSARIAGALGGAVDLEVDLERLVRPALAADPRLRAAELIVRTSCVGETLTVPLLKHTRSSSASPLLAAALHRVVSDESAHALLGTWFLDWADAWLDDDARALLGRVAGTALRAFAPLLDTSGEPGEYQRTLAEAVASRVVRPLGERGIGVPVEDLAALLDGGRG